MMTVINDFFECAFSSYSQKFEFTKIKLLYVCGVGFFGFPIFFFIWNDYIKQPYENMPIRLSCSLLCGVGWILLSAGKKFQKDYSKTIIIFSYFATIACLPCFFSFMALKNGLNPVWMGSLIGSILYTVVMFDLANMFITQLIGQTTGAALFLLENSQNVFPENISTYIPILIFVFTAAVIYSRTETLLEDKNAARLRAASSIGSSVAHEVRTPLMGIECELDILRQNLPKLLTAYDMAAQSGVKVPWIHPADRAALAETVDGIETLTKVASTMIKMLLMNIGTQQIDSAGFSVYSMREVVDAAIKAYPYNENERDRVIWRPESDFAFFGSDLLMRHVLFNLLKNALFAVKKCPGGFIEIRLVPGRDDNRLIVRDTGLGVLPELLPHLFEPFITGSKSGEGVGIGLAFCKRVIDSFKGTIQCHSERGRFTEFVIILPPD